MLLKGIDHITINVKDIETSIEFYTKMFNLKKLDTVDMGDHKLQYLSLPGNCRLELISYDNPGLELATKNIDLGIYRHIAFRVDNIEEIMQKCDVFSVKIHLGPLFIERLNIKILLIEDPNGIEIEIIEQQTHK